jgi:hypothetical protein
VRFVGILKETVGIPFRMRLVVGMSSQCQWALCRFWSLMSRLVLNRRRWVVIRGAACDLR